MSRPSYTSRRKTGSGGESGASYKVTTSGESILLSSGHGRLISLDRETTSTGKKDSLEFRSSVSLASSGSSHMTPIPIFRLSFLPSQCPHFNSRHPVRLEIQFAL